MGNLGIAYGILALGSCVTSGVTAQPFDFFREAIRQARPAPPAMDEAAKRRVIAPLARATTDCFSWQVMSSNEVSRAYHDGQLAPLLRKVAPACADQIADMTGAHDQLYGAGTGREFYEGAYFDDLPRAVVRRNKPALDRASADIDKSDAEAKRLAAVRAEQDAQSEIQRRALQEAADRERQVEDARAEADKQTALRRAADERAARIVTLQGTTDLIGDKARDCVTKQANSMVASGEAASAIANAAVMLCQDVVEQALQSTMQLREAQADKRLSTPEQAIFLADARVQLVQIATALAIKAKAGLAR